MRTLNTKNELQIEVLSPLHVGAGAEKDWVKGSDFIEDEGKVKILNLKKMSQFVNISDLTDALIKKDSQTLISKLANNLSKCIDKEFDCNYTGTNDIKTFIKNGLSNKPIVPGSSIKGALRSVLVDYLLDGSKRLNEKELFGTPSDGDEFMRFIKVSDAAFENTKLVNTKVFNLKSTTEGGWKFSGGKNSRTNTQFQSDGFNTFYEVIEPNEKSSLSISIADKAFSNFAKEIKAFSKQKTDIINSDISFLFRIINQHTEKYLEKEKAFFTKYATDKTYKIIESIDFLISQIPKNGECCILKMAAGSGFHSITGDWQFDDYSIDRIRENGYSTRGTKNGKESAKSRKIVIQGGRFSLMGFIKLKVKTEEDIQLEKELALQKEKEIEAKIVAEKLAKAEALRLQKIKEQEEQAEKQRIIDEAKKLEEDRIAEQKRLEAERIARLQEEEKQRLIKREQYIEDGLSFLNDIETFDKAGRRINDWLKKSENTILPENQLPILKERMEYWSLKAKLKPRNWKQFQYFCNNTLPLWVGKDLAVKWTEEFLK